MGMIDLAEMHKLHEKIILGINHHKEQGAREIVIAMPEDFNRALTYFHGYIGSQALNNFNGYQTYLGHKIIPAYTQEVVIFEPLAIRQEIKIQPVRLEINYVKILKA